MENVNFYVKTEEKILQSIEKEYAAKYSTFNFLFLMKKCHFLRFVRSYYHDIVPCNNDHCSSALFGFSRPITKATSGIQDNIPIYCRYG